MTQPDGVIGCEYCRNHANPLTDGLASNPVRMTILLECPRCGHYYGLFGLDPDNLYPLTEADAAECFPDAFRFGRPIPNAAPGTSFGGER